MSRRAAEPNEVPADGWPCVRVVFTCPENSAHVLGAVARQSRPVPGNAAGREVVADECGLRLVHGPGGAKLLGGCRTCRAQGSRRAPRMGWARVTALLDYAETTGLGEVRVPLTG